MLTCSFRWFALTVPLFFIVTRIMTGDDTLLVGLWELYADDAVFFWVIAPCGYNGARFLIFELNSSLLRLHTFKWQGIGWHIFR